MSAVVCEFRVINIEYNTQERLHIMQCKHTLLVKKRIILCNWECDFVSAATCTPIGSGTLPVDHGNVTENVPSYAERELSLCQQRVCELQGQQWRFDRHVSGSAYCEQSMKSASQELNAFGSGFLEFDRFQQSFIFIRIFFAVLSC